MSRYGALARAQTHKGWTTRQVRVYHPGGSVSMDPLEAEAWALAILDASRLARHAMPPDYPLMYEEDGDPFNPIWDASRASPSTPESPKEETTDA